MTEEHILDFLDGNLGASEEEELLHRLAVSPERRNLLKQHLQVRELTASLARRQYVPVPKMVTASLFTTLAANGYAGPHVPAELNQKESLIASLEKNLDKSAEKIIATKNAPVFRRSFVAIASIVSFLMGAAVLYLLMPEARQSKFAENISDAFKGTSTASVAASIPLRSSVISIPDQASIANSQTNSYSEIGKENHLNRENPVVANTLGLSDFPIAKAIDNSNINQNSQLSGNANTPIITIVDSKSVPVIASAEDVHGNTSSAKSPFDPIVINQNAERTFWNRFTLSLRSGEGKAPGNAQAFTGSMIEGRLSYDISDLFVAKVSLGEFMPYETQAIAAQPGFNRDGIPLLQLSPVLRYRYMVGAELGMKFNMFSAPFEVTGGFISDLQGSIIPRAGFFTNLSVNDNFSMNLGIEGMIYTHDIGASIRSAQSAFAGAHPLLIGSLQQKESTGFIGPAVEMVWRF